MILLLKEKEANFLRSWFQNTIKRISALLKSHLQDYTMDDSNLVKLIQKLHIKMYLPCGLMDKEYVVFIQWNII